MSNKLSGSINKFISPGSPRLREKHKLLPEKVVQQQYNMRYAEFPLSLNRQAYWPYARTHCNIGRASRQNQLIVQQHVDFRPKRERIGRKEAMSLKLLRCRRDHYLSLSLGAPLCQLGNHRVKSKQNETTCTLWVNYMTANSPLSSFLLLFRVYVCIPSAASSERPEPGSLRSQENRGVQSQIMGVSPPFFFGMR